MKKIATIAVLALTTLFAATSQAAKPEDMSNSALLECANASNARAAVPEHRAMFRHYLMAERGYTFSQLSSAETEFKAQGMDEGGKKSGFVGVIASYMKLAYRTWNKEHYVSDEVIKNDLETLSEGSLEVDDNASLDNLTNANRRRKRSNDNNGRGDRDKGHHSNGRRGYRDRGQSRGRRRN